MLIVNHRMRVDCISFIPQESSPFSPAMMGKLGYLLIKKIRKTSFKFKGEIQENIVVI